VDCGHPEGKCSPNVVSDIGAHGRFGLLLPCGDRPRPDDLARDFLPAIEVSVPVDEAPSELVCSIGRLTEATAKRAGPDAERVVGELLNL
jgi:hypothetical protein